jgi:hypothetical protein
MTLVVNQPALYLYWMKPPGTTGKHQQPTYMSIKKGVLEKRQIKPVHTSTIGHFYSLENEYSQKMAAKIIFVWVKAYLK